MECLVDAGVIFSSIKGKSARDCAIAAIIDAGDRVRFPITVIDRETGEETKFWLVEEHKAPTTDQPQQREMQRPLTAEEEQSWKDATFGG